jgi:hypothetical protein
VRHQTTARTLHTPTLLLRSVTLKYGHHGQEDSCHQGLCPEFSDCCRSRYAECWIARQEYSHRGDTAMKKRRVTAIDDDEEDSKDDNDESDYGSNDEDDTDDDD